MSTRVDNLFADVHIHGHLTVKRSLGFHNYMSEGSILFQLITANPVPV